MGCGWRAGTLAMPTARATPREWVPKRRQDGRCSEACSRRPSSISKSSSATRTPGGRSRLDPFINIVGHAGKYLALAERTPPYEVTADLATVGLYDFGGAIAGMCAHPKMDSVTGEMALFRYEVEEPYLTWAVVGADGSVTRPLTPVEGVDRGYDPQLRHHGALRHLGHRAGCP